MQVRAWLASLTGESAEVAEPYPPLCFWGFGANHELGIRVFQEKSERGGLGSASSALPAVIKNNG